MTKNSLRNFLMLVLLLAAATTAAQAQSSERISVNVPFDFVVGAKTLPAGDYTIMRIGRDSAGTLLVRSADGRNSELIQTNGVQAAATQKAARLDFHRYGNRYFLFQLWTPGSNAGRELPKSRLERGVETETAANAHDHDSARQTVAVIKQ